MKRRQVVCVGRWQDVVQKRPWLLMEVIGSLVAADAEVAVMIAGAVTSELETWHRGLNESRRARVQLRGHVDRDELATLLRQSQVFYSPSAFESFGIAAAEALCTGCAVVAGRSVSMAGFEWFVAEDSGTLASLDSPQNHVRALLDELESWQRGDRSPEQISRIWCDRLHAERVATRVIELSNQSTFAT